MPSSEQSILLYSTWVSYCYARKQVDGHKRGLGRRDAQSMVSAVPNDDHGRCGRSENVSNIFAHAKRNDPFTRLGSYSIPPERDDSGSGTGKTAVLKV